MKFGTLLRISDPAMADEKFRELQEAGFSSCQLVYKPAAYDLSLAAPIKAAADKYGIEISAQFCGYYDAETTWDLYYGYQNAGLNVEAFRQSRTEYVKSACNFAAALGVEDVIIHAGFVPNDPFAPQYASMCAAIYSIASHCKKLGLNLLFETGGEAPITLLRLIQDVGTGNLFVNFDPANILMYGYGNPTDALEIIGPYVRNVHGKDGLLPTDPRKLGVETPVGQGRVDFPAVIAKLKALGYDRFITIEREITGEQQKKDIQEAKAFFENLWKQHSEQ